MMIKLYDFQQQVISRSVRNNLKKGIHYAPPEKLRKALLSTMIYTILSICKGMIDNGSSFEEAMDYCSERVLKEDLVKHYVSYIFNNHFTFGLKSYGAMITDKIAAQFIRYEEVYDGFYHEDLSSVMNLDSSSPHVRKSLNFLKLKHPKCVLINGMSEPDKINTNLLYIELKLGSIPNKYRAEHCMAEVISVCKIPTMKSLGGFRG